MKKSIRCYDELNNGIPLFIAKCMAFFLLTFYKADTIMRVKVGCICRWRLAQVVICFASDRSCTWEHFGVLHSTPAILDALTLPLPLRCVCMNKKKEKKLDGYGISLQLQQLSQLATTKR